MRTPRRRAKRLVFVSHSSKDTWVAQRIADAIHELGAEAFLDEAEIEVGADFEKDILAFLNRAHELVVLITPWALDRPYVWAELGAAWGRRIKIVAVLHGLTAAELQAKPGIPVFLKERNMVEINQVGTYLKQLARRINYHKHKAHAS